MDRLEKLGNTNLTNKGKYKAMMLMRNNPRDQHRMGANWHKSSCAKNNW